MPHDSDHVRDWLWKAENDLKAAKAISHYYEDPPTDTICYHSHQVVEKCLKAVLLFFDADLVKVHDLIEILNLCIQHEPDLNAFRESLETLNQYYIEAKYPLDHPII